MSSLIKIILCLTTILSVPSIVYSQNLKLISEFEHTFVRENLLNPNNIAEEANLVHYNLLKAKKKWKKKDNLIVADFAISNQYQSVKSKMIYNKNKLEVYPIEFYWVRHVYNWNFVLGRRKINHGVGYVASPTDIISDQTIIEDPKDRLYRIKGNDLLEITYSGEKGWQPSLYLLPKFGNNENNYFNEHTIALSVYKSFKNIESTVISRFGFEDKYQLGFNSVYSIGRKIEVHIDCQYNNKNIVQYPVNGTLSYDDRTSFRMLLGGNWSPNNKWNFATEYLFISDGYHQDDWVEFKDIVNYNRELYLNQIGVISEAAKNNLLSINEMYSFPVLQNHIFLRVARQELLNDKLNIAYVLFLNLGQFDSLHRLNITYEMNKFFKFYFHSQWVLSKEYNNFSSLNHFSKHRLGIKFNYNIKHKKRKK